MLIFLIILGLVALKSDTGQAVRSRSPRLVSRRLLPISIGQRSPRSSSVEASRYLCGTSSQGIEGGFFGHRDQDSQPSEILKPDERIPAAVVIHYKILEPSLRASEEFERMLPAKKTARGLDHFRKLMMLRSSTSSLYMMISEWGSMEAGVKFLRNPASLDFDLEKLPADVTRARELNVPQGARIYRPVQWIESPDALALEYQVPPFVSYEQYRINPVRNGTEYFLQPYLDHAVTQCVNEYSGHIRTILLKEYIRPDDDMNLGETYVAIKFWRSAEEYFEMAEREHWREERYANFISNLLKSDAFRQSPSIQLLETVLLETPAVTVNAPINFKNVDWLNEDFAVGNEGAPVEGSLEAELMEHAERQKRRAEEGLPLEPPENMKFIDPETGEEHDIKQRYKQDLQ